MRLLLSLVLSLFLLGGCTSDAPSDTSDTLACSPDTLRAGQAITIDIPSDPGGDLAVIDPSGTVHFAYRAGQAHPQLAPVPTRSTLRGESTLRWPVDSLALKPYAYDARAASHVFRSPGTYTIQLGSDLAAPSAPTHRCSVYFTHERP